MDRQSRDFIEAEFTAINFLLQNLYAIVLKAHGASPDDLDAFSDEMLRQFETLPSTGGEDDETHVLRETAANRIATFLAHVRARLESDQDRDSRP